MIRFVLAAGLAMGALPAQAQKPVMDTETLLDYRNLAQMDQRVANVSYRLASSAHDWCSRKAPSLGWTLTDRSQYPARDQRAASIAYGTRWPKSGDIIIAAVAQGGPAAKAGLRVGEAVSAIDGESLAGLASTPKRKKRGSYSRMTLIDQGMARWLADGKAEVRVQTFSGQGSPQAVPSTITIKAEHICATRFSVRADDDFNGGADGEQVQITAALAEYAARDDELAAVLAHEFAHNILNHRVTLDAAGARRGLLREFGKKTQLTRKTEEEADRLSVWLLAKAGYDPMAAARLWLRFGPEHDGGLLRSRSHGSWKERVDIMNREAQMVKAAFARDHSARPPLITAWKADK